MWIVLNKVLKKLEYDVCMIYDIEEFDIVDMKKGYMNVIEIEGKLSGIINLKSSDKYTNDI